MVDDTWETLTQSLLNRQNPEEQGYFPASNHKLLEEIITKICWLNHGSVGEALWTKRDDSNIAEDWKNC